MKSVGYSNLLYILKVTEFSSGGSERDVFKRTFCKAEDFTSRIISSKKMCSS